jgi:hypothetical protein
MTNKTAARGYNRPADDDEHRSFFVLTFSPRTTSVSNAG